jgi:hypothetical protein
LLARRLNRLDEEVRAAARTVAADSTWHNLRVLEEAVARYGPPRVLYSDNGSIFRIIRHGGSRFFVYRPEVLAGETPTPARPRSASWGRSC